jgi:hypothetical protein
METPRDEQLVAELRALRPTPRPEFAAKLDERAAAGFPRRSHLPRLRLALPSRRVLIPAGALAVVAVAAVIAISATVADNETGSESGAGGALLGDLHMSDSGSPGPVEEVAPSTGDLPSSAASAGGNTASSAASAGGDSELEPFSRKVAPQIRHRAVERSAELTLTASPADVADDASKVFEAVHAHDGIVMRSSTREGKPGEAAARFELLIPSAKLSDALAALSAIDEVRSRHEATDDITVPTVATGELLADSKARVDSLLAQLEGAETESEREAVEAELAGERRHRARLRAQLQHLERRADYSRVLVRIETGAADESSSGGAWGVGDALDDAGKILAVAVAVTVVTVAILGPIALIALLAWLAHRAWVRRERRRVLN